VTLFDVGPQVEMSARFSPCGTYRYTLTRHWGPGEALVFMMLNPSTADARRDDPTIKQCVYFAKREGYDGLVVLNLYAMRTPDPRVLFAFSHDPIGPENDDYIWMLLEERVRRGLPVVAAWGAHAKPERVAQVLEYADGVDWRCLGVTKTGAPRHPLYIRHDAPLTRWAA
jgi:hypothetical protein